MKWTKEHATCLELEIKRLIASEEKAGRKAAREVLHAARIALINLRRPVES